MSSVFGFNTDIRYGDTVYHVQTEARESELIVQTAIFVRGRCVDKQESSYAHESSAAGFSAASVQQLLTRQHRFIVNRIREGQIGSVQSVGQNARMAAATPGVAHDFAESTPVPTPAPVDPERFPEPEPARAPISQPEVAEIPELKLEWLSSESVFSGNSVKLRYRLTIGPRGVEGAKIVVRLEVGGVPSAYARTVSDCEGEGEVTLKLPSAVQQPAALTFTVQASHAGQSTARRFRLTRS